ncbi:hypothetical protein KEM54_006496 [Ascosphaera aggregata]|nr:hypothetical protein KEM54_006496 [Ascosphaera aggregata]
MTVILADEQFTDYYNVTPGRSGVIATIPWATTEPSVVQIVPNTYGVLVLGRLITGLGSLRGSFVGTVSQFGYQLGTLIAFWAGYGMSFHKHPYNIAWRISNFIQIPIGIIFLILSKYYPESPRFLLEKHPDEPQKALAVLAKLRGGDENAAHVQEEWQEILTSWEFRKNNPTGYMGILKSASLRKRLAYGFFATSLQQAGGIASLTMYAVLIYKSLGWDEGSQALAINGAQACLQLVIVLVNTFTVDRFGRKTLLLFGFAIQSLALLLMSILLSVYPNNENRPAGVILVLLFLPETKGISLERMDSIFGAVDYLNTDTNQSHKDVAKGSIDLKTVEQVDDTENQDEGVAEPVATRTTHADLEKYKV